MKVAVCYDWANQFGGAERVLGLIAKIWPESDLFTSVFDPKKANWARSFASIKTTFIQKIPFSGRYYRLLGPLMPLGFEQFDLDPYDLVISVTSGPAKAVITKPETCHICYCLSPPRYFWEREFLFKASGLFPWLSVLRAKDYFFAQRPDFILAISKNVAERVEKFYHRKAKVIYPGIDLDKFKPARTRGVKSRLSFLMVSRLVEYKMIDLVIRVFNQLDWPLRIVGVGREERCLKKIAKGNISFLGRIDDQELVLEYQKCRALIVPQKEDFGLASIEAQSCGKPVIAFGAGGNLETIIPGKTGEFFYSQSEEALTNILKGFSFLKYRPADCRTNAKKFSQEKFLNNFRKAVTDRLRIYRERFSIKY